MITKERLEHIVEAAEKNNINVMTLTSTDDDLDILDLALWALEYAIPAMKRITEFMYGENGEVLNDKEANKQQVILARDTLSKLPGGGE